MAPTTITVSTETRDRIRDHRDQTLEDTILRTLDALDAQQFWAETDAGLAYLAGLPEAQRRAMADEEARVDAALRSIS